MSLKKQYLTSKPVCKVTFRLLKDETNVADTVHVVGEFNDWNTTATPMKKTSAGNFSVTVDLNCSQEYQYRYLLNNETWMNDPAADSYVFVPDVGTDNSVVIVGAPKQKAPKTAAPPKATSPKSGKASPKGGKAA